VEAYKPDYPDSFEVADVQSQKKQKYYINFKRFEFSVIVIAAAFSMFPSDVISPEISGLLSGSALMVAALIIIIERVYGPKKNWFNYRALAESVKAESWRFRMAVSPYDSAGQELEVAKSKLKSTIQKTTKSLTENIIIIDKDGGKPEITDDMINFRALGWKEQVEKYRKYRIMDQYNWYKGKTQKCLLNFQLFLGVLLVSLITGFTFGILQYCGEIDISPVGFFSALAASCAGWMQLRRFEMLSFTYSRAANELSSLADIARDLADTDEDMKRLTNLVEDTEDVISKEHMVWVQRG